MESNERILTFIKNNDKIQYFSDVPDIVKALNQLGYDVYYRHIVDGRDIDNCAPHEYDMVGLYSQFDSILMDNDEYRVYKDTGIGAVQLHPNICVYSICLEDINEEEYDVLPNEYKEEYINYLFDNVFTRDELIYIVENIKGHTIFNSNAARLREIASDYV